MAAPSLKKLRGRASMALRNEDFDDAIATYEQLEAREPRNPVWPQRRAEILLRQGLAGDALVQFEHALGLAATADNVMVAISICKQILSIDPHHETAIGKLHAMHGESAPRMAAKPSLPKPLPAERSDAPLDEMLLTEVVPRTSPHASEHLENSGIVEIPLARSAASNTPQSIDPAATGGIGGQLSRTPLFGSLSHDGLRSLITGAKIVSLDEGEVLFRQGDPADSLYVVVDGAVVPIAEEDPRKRLAVLEAGAFFGEIALITEGPRNATIQAIVETRLLEIDRKAIRALIRKHREVLDVILCFLRDRLVDRLMRTNPLFMALPPRQRPPLARQFRLLEVRAGSTLVEQGRPSESLYALLAGSAQVIEMDTDSDKVLAELGPGDIFGEMSVLDASPAMAAVVATQKCWILALSRARLLRLTEHNPRAEAVIRKMSLARKRENRRRQGKRVDVDGVRGSLS